MLALRTAIRQTLLADAPIVAELAPIPATDPQLSAVPAVYLNHIASVVQVLFPCISLFDDGGADPAIKCARDLRLQVDVWTEERPKTTGQAYGLTGADRIYQRARTLLHAAEQRGVIVLPGYTVPGCTLVPGSEGDDFERPQRLHHCYGVFAVKVVPVDEQPGNAR